MLLAGAALVLTGAGCGGGTEVRSAGQEAGSVASSLCITADEVIGSISRFARAEKRGVTLTKMRAVLLTPPVGGFAYVLAGDVEGPDMEGRGPIAVWAVHNLNVGAVLAVNNFAREFFPGEGDGAPEAPGRVRSEIAARPEATTARQCVQQS